MKFKSTDCSIEDNSVIVIEYIVTVNEFLSNVVYVQNLLIQQVLSFYFLCFQNLKFILLLKKQKLGAMIFRRARLEDVPKIVEMLAEDALGVTRERFENPLPQVYTDAFQNIDKDTNQELIVVENENGQVIGTLQLSFLQYLTYQGGIRAQIEAVRIHKDFRNKGLGEEFFRWAIDRAQEKGAHVLQLTSDKKRPDAIRFYEKLGFVASHEGMKLHFKKD